MTTLITYADDGSIAKIALRDSYGEIIKDITKSPKSPYTFVYTDYDYMGSDNVRYSYLNEKGQIVKIESYYEVGGLLSSEATLRYSALGNLIKEVWTDREGRVLSIDEYEDSDYDEFGNRVDFDDNCEYEYDPDGNSAQMTRKSVGYTETFYYTLDGNITRYTYKDSWQGDYDVGYKQVEVVNDPMLLAWLEQIYPVPR